MMMNSGKYCYPAPVPIKDRTWPDKIIDHEPIWSSVDLRDGNQALPMPMSPERKMDYFKLLVDMGFKEIEVGFPSASQDDFDFVRKLIEDGLIPDGVRISVLTQARRHLIERTVESLRGVKRGLIHCYVATSDLHGRIVFDRGRDEVMEMAVAGTDMVVECLDAAGMRGDIAYEFSPEEFTDSDLDFTIKLCAAVKERWGDCVKEDFILNLPATVERRPPYQYADMIEYFRREYPYTDTTTISIHAHNDQGCAVAASEMALMAGADRVEGTLFGHGERTGNLDIVTLALNLYSRGIEIGLDFSDMPRITRVVEDASGIDVHQRHPYAGGLVFTAFSGSHQDAIRKGIDLKDKAAALFGGWKVPYLHIDPADLGRSYEKLIRINSQSGKGGAAYVLEHEFEIFPPKRMHREIGEVMQRVAEAKGGEIDAYELCDAFNAEFVEVDGPYRLVDFSRVHDGDIAADHIRVRLVVGMADGVEFELSGDGNGPISAAVHALRGCPEVMDFVLDDFAEQTLGRNADALALAYVGVRRPEDRKVFYGAGQHSNIDRAALRALFAAINRATVG